MYKPKFNHLLVEINDKAAEWGSSETEKVGGVAYREGKLIEVGKLLPYRDFPLDNQQLIDVGDYLDQLVGKSIMWNEGHEAGTVFEHEGKKYCLIFWWDVIGEKV